MNLSRLKLPATIALCSFLGACANTAQQSNLALEQDQALQRWANCIDRQSEQGKASETLSLIEQYCEGHKRDLLAAYPPHLETQLTHLLADRTRKLAAQQIAQSTPNINSDVVSVTLK